MVRLRCHVPSQQLAAAREPAGGQDERRAAVRLAERAAEANLAGGLGEDRREPLGVEAHGPS